MTTEGRGHTPLPSSLLQPQPKGMIAMSRTYRAQKAALTRAVNSGNPDKIRAECVRAKNEWDKDGIPWPDDWHRWNIAYEDTFAWNEAKSFENA